MRDSAAGKYKFSAIVLGIVKSPPFQMNMKIDDGDKVAGGARQRAAVKNQEGNRIMFITKKHMSRRTILRGAGATLALPLLDAMMPASTALAQTAATPKPRFVGCFVPHGAAPGYWVPGTEGKLDAELPFNWKPLEPFVNQTVIMSGLHSRSAEPPPGATGADHWVAAAFLCANKPKKTAGADVYARNHDRSDHRAEDRQANLMPSMQLAVEDPGANSSNCGEGYSCTYTNTISWSSPTDPLPMELNPQVVFERMFGDGSTRRAARRAAKAGPQHSGLAHRQSLPASRRSRAPPIATRLDNYTEDVREIERRLQIAMKASTVAPTDMSVPVGVPQTFDEHIKLQFDLLALAFQADITRVGTLLFARDLTGRTYPESEAPTSGFHGVSHHGEDPEEYRAAIEDQPVSRQDAGAFHRQAGQDPRTATARCWIIRWCSMAATWATPISISTTMCRMCWSAD